jgi:preprotein translocase subunit SecD
MRIRPWQTLIVIVLLSLAAVWVDLPGQQLDPFGWKRSITVRLGLDLQGGVQLVLQARPPAGVTVTQDVLQGTRDTIERRVNGLGVSEPVIQTRGTDQILVELPGFQDPERAVRVLQRTALLEIIDTRGEFLPVGTTVNTTLGPASDVAPTRQRARVHQRQRLSLRLRARQLPQRPEPPRLQQRHRRQPVRFTRPSSPVLI